MLAVPAAAAAVAVNVGVAVDVAVASSSPSSTFAGRHLSSVKITNTTKATRDSAC